MNIKFRKFNPFKFIKYLFLIIIPVIIITPSLISSTQGSVRYSEEKLSILFPSTTRQVIELSGNWDKSTNGNDWTTVSLPSTDGNKDRVVYKKNLSIDPSMIKKYSWALHFYGLSDQVEVYLNSQLIGKYFGAMTPFSVNIHKNLLKPNQNILQLVVTPADKYSELIKEKNIYFKLNSIGIQREIFLVGTPQVWIKEINYKTQLNNTFNSANINAKVDIASGQISGLQFNQNDSTSTSNINVIGKVNVSINASIYTKADNTLIATSEPQNITMENERTASLNFNFNVANPLLWSPESPNLYYVKVSISTGGSLIDELSQNLGIREVKTINKSNNSGVITLNGQPFVIKGIDYIEDHYNTGSSLTPYRMEQDIILLKTMGANLVRFKYSVPHPYLVYLCDKYGLFLTVDVPLYNVPSDFFNVYEIQSRMKNLVERITQNYNGHPATFAYCISEGLIETPNVLSTLEALSSRFKANTDKLLMKSILLGSKQISTKNIDIITVLDNRKYLPYETLYNQIRNILSISEGKPVVINFGFPIQINNSNGYSDPLSLEAQRNYMLHNANLVNNNKLAGLIFWAFNDYKLNNPLLTVNNYNQDIASVGLFNQGRQQRLSYSTLQAIYTSQQEQPLLTAGSYNETIPIFYIITCLLLIIILFTFSQRFKRFRENLTRSLIRPYNFYADIRDQRIKSNGHTLILAFIIALSVGLYISAILYNLRSSDIAQQFLMSFINFDAILPGLFNLIWLPHYMTLTIATIFILAIFIIAGFIRLISLFVKSRIYYTDTLTVVVWACVPLLILLPVALFISKLLSAFPYLTLFVLLLTLVLFVWVLFRIIKATTVVFDIKKPIISYSIGAGFAVIVLVAFLFILNSSISTFSYLSYLYQYLLNS